MTIAEKIKNLRMSIGITQDELAKLLGVRTNSVMEWELGQIDSIPLSKIKAMAGLFCVNPSYLIEDDIHYQSA